MLTPEEIIADLKTDRVKKCILDSDMFCEIDDQYAFAYCLGSDKIDLLSVNAVHFYNPYLYDNLAVTTDLSYDEALRVLDACNLGIKDCPVIKAQRRPSPKAVRKSPLTALPHKISSKRLRNRMRSFTFCQQALARPL